MFKKILILFIFISGVFVSKSQDSIPILLTNKNIELQATYAVDLLYNFKFDEARKEFNYMKYKYPWHPMPYFLIGFTYWWKMQPDVAHIKQYDKKFMSYMDSVIYLSEKILKRNDNNLDAVFFLTAAYGFQARIHSERSNYSKATYAGKKTLDYLEEGKKYTEFSPEFLFGQGLYNYYEPWIKENYPFLKPILMFFSNGNKELGINQLKEASRSSFYTRTESQYFLMDILLKEKMRKEAIVISEYLHSLYPDNPVFHIEYARLLFLTGYHNQALQLCNEIMSRVDSSYNGYDGYTARSATYFMGNIYHFVKKDFESAKKYYQINIKITNDLDIEKAAYYLHSNYYMGKIYASEEKHNLAKPYYREVVKEGDRKSNIYKESKLYLKKH